MPIEFAEMFARLGADDTELQRDLKAAESAVKASGARMQGSLDTLKVSAGNLSPVLGTLSQVGASVGGEFGGMVGKSVAAANALSGMSAAISGPVGLVAALGALTVGVVAYREESGQWLNSMLQAIGILEDLDAALAASEARNKAKTDTLEKQRKVYADLNAELRDASRIARAQGLNNPEEMARVVSEIAIRKREEAVRAAGGGQNAVDLVRKIAEQNERAARSKERQLAFDKQRAEYKKEEVERSTRLQAIESNRLSVARGLLVQIGAAAPSEFIDDPVMKRLAQLGETVAARNKAAAEATPEAASSGTFGLRRVSGNLNTIRAGEIIGRQQLTIVEQQKRVQEEHRDIAREARDILKQINSRGQGGAMTGGGLIVTGNP